MKKIIIIFSTLIFLAYNSFSYEGEIQSDKINIQMRKVIEKIRFKKYREAIQQLKKVIRKSPDNFRAKFLLGKCYTQIHAYEKAVNVYGNILSSSPRNLYALLEIASAYQRMYKINKSIYYYKIVEKKAPRSPYPIYGLIQAYLIKGKLVKVRQYIDTLEELKNNFRNSGLIITLFKIKILNSKNLNMEAYEIVKRALYSYGEHSRSLLMEKFQLLYDMSNLRKAEGIIDRLYKSGYKTKDVYKGLIEISLEYKNYDLAEKYVEEFNKKFGSTFRYYFYKYLISNSKKQRHDSIKYLLKSLARNRYQANVHYALVEEYIKSGKMELANQWIKEFEELFKELRGINFLKVKLLYKANKKKQSLDLLNNLINRNKNDLSFLINASYFLWTKLKNYNFALRLMKKALKLYPNNERLLNNLAYFYATVKEKSLRNPVLALRYAKRAVKLSLGLNAAFLDTLASAYFSLNNKSKAIEIQRRVIDMNPADPTFRKTLKKFIKKR